MTGTLRDGLARALAEVAYAEIAAAKYLTVAFTGPNSAIVPPHWRDEANAKAKPYLDAALAYLAQQRPDVEAIAGVLRVHELKIMTSFLAKCQCGDVMRSESPSERWGWHRAHQAEQIAALPPQTHRMPPRSDQDGSVGTDDRAGRNGEPE